jgi:hypothetical protein
MMRPEPISSDTTILPPAQILVEFLRRYGSGQHPTPAALAALAQELEMEDAEAIQFGNTAFISHYTADGQSVFMRALNVDTAKNFVDNIENYVAHVYRRGVKTITTAFTDDAIAGAIRTVKQRIEKLNRAVKAELTFDVRNEQTVAIIQLKEY